MHIKLLATKLLYNITHHAVNLINVTTVATFLSRGAGHEDRT